MIHLANSTKVLSLRIKSVRDDMFPFLSYSHSHLSVGLPWESNEVATKLFRTRQHDVMTSDDKRKTVFFIAISYHLKANVHNR